MLEQHDPTVLIVEPSRHFVSLLRHILSVGGIKRAYHAADGYGALELIKSHHIDVMLLDSEISGISAMELTHVIRMASDSPNKTLPIMLLSDRPTRRLITKAMNAGVSCYVKKPVSAQTLLDRLKWLLTDGKETDCAETDGRDGEASAKASARPVSDAA